MFFALATSFAATAGAWQFTVINADTPAKPEEVVIANAVEPVVVEPPASFGLITTHAGFIVGESYDLEALGMKAVKVITPASMSEDYAVAVIENTSRISPSKARNSPPKRVARQAKQFPC